MGNYNLAKIKVKFVDDERVFDAYELQDENGKCVEHNSGWFTHPHFDKETALQVADYFNELFAYDGESFAYDSETDTFTELDDGEIIYWVTCNRYGFYEIGHNWAWEKVI